MKRLVQRSSDQFAVLRFLKGLDFGMAGAAATLAVIGLGAIASTTGAVHGSTGFLTRQAIFLVFGIGVFCAVSRIPVTTLRRIVPAGFGLTVVVLLAVLGPLGSTVNGTKGWIRLGPLSVQPAEFAKIAVIVALAAALTRPPGRLYARMSDAATDPRRLALALSLLATVTMLVLAEGETGSVLVYCMVAMVIFFIAGSPPRLLGLLVVSGIMTFALAFSSGLLGDHVADRFTSFLDADADPQGAGYNQIQSVTAIGSGGLVGQGIFEGPQTQFGFLPEKQTDFIFAAVGEETGFLGVVAVLALYGLLLRQVFRTAVGATDRFGRLVAIGVFAMLMVQVVQNVGMTIRLLPITGIPLPLVSYGGSSLLTTMIALGLVQSVHNARQPKADADELSDPLDAQELILADLVTSSPEGAHPVESVAGLPVVAGAGPSPSIASDTL